MNYPEERSQAPETHREKWSYPSGSWGRKCGEFALQLAAGLNAADLDTLSQRNETRRNGLNQM